MPNIDTPIFTTDEDDGFANSSFFYRDIHCEIIELSSEVGDSPDGNKHPDNKDIYIALNE